LQAFSYKKYLHTAVSDQASAGVMMEQFGAPLIGGQPAVDYFEAVATAHRNGCVLVTAGKALKQCKAIARACGLDAAIVIGIDELP